MVSKRRGKSFFLLHSIFAIIFVSGLFLANLLASHEYATSLVPDSPLPSFVKPRYSVQSTALYPANNGPQVSLIVDDVGENIVLLKRLLTLQIPVTVSILPGSPYDQQSAQWARDHGFEVMVHLPMEPDAYPDKDPGPNALFTGMNRKQLVQSTEQLIERIPYAVGVNNHMGSRLTSKWAAMNIVMNVIARKGLFFVDSRTSATTVAFQIAQQKHIPSAERSLFLDDASDTENVHLRFEELIQLARDKGTGVGICHLKPETVSALQSLNASHYSDIRFIYASSVVR